MPGIHAMQCGFLAVRMEALVQTVTLRKNRGYLRSFGTEKSDFDRGGPKRNIGGTENRSRLDVEGGMEKN
jgi:hypothetical protein